MNILIYILMVIILLAAIGVVTLRNLFHSALSLVLTLFTVAALYICLKAEFIAVVQVLLYVGAIITLILFAVMLTHRISDQTIPAANHQRLIAMVGLAAFGIFLVTQIAKTSWPQSAVANTAISAGHLGEMLTGPFVFPFELASVILIAALIGAVVIAKDK